MKHCKRLLALLLSLSMVLGLGILTAAAEESVQSVEEGWDRIRVFETTDVHGYLLDTSSGDEATFQYRMAYLAKVFNDAKADPENAGVLLLDGGDIYQGTPVSNLTYGSAMRAAYDAMGYDAVCLGNHEFDWDVATYAADEQGTMSAYEIGAFKGDSDIPVLAYNLYNAGTTDRASFVKDYTVVTKSGYKIAIIGYIPDYSRDIMAAKINPYDIDQDVERLKAKIAAVNQAEAPDVTILLAHDSPRALASALDPEEVDLVFGGHSHTVSTGVADNGIPYLQGNCQAQGYATGDIMINQETGEVKVENLGYVATTSSDNRPNLYDTEGNDKLDPTVLAISKAAWEAVKGDMQEVLGTVDQSITRRVKIGDSNNTIAGNWLAGLMLEATKELNTVAAFTNSGGIRCDLLMEEGATTRDITVGDIYTISPFGNRLLTYDLTGKELAQTVVNGFKNANYGDQFSGMVVTYTRAPDTVNEDGRPVRGEVTVRSITLDDGTVVDINDDTKTYRVCVNEYCATLAGSVFENKTPVQDINEAPIDNTSAIAALREIGKANDGKLPLDLTPRCVPVDICSLYPDVNTEYWYHSGIHYALETGLMVGYEDQTFRPDEQLSRAMAVTVLYRLAGEPEVTAADTFSDVPDNVWYTNAVAWAVEEGYVYGYDDGCFRPDQSVSRQELVAILYRYAEKNGYDMQAGGDLSGFTDVDALHDFAKTPMAWATGKSLVEGMENQTLQPLGTATRAQFVTLMLRLSKLTEAAE